MKNTILLFIFAIFLSSTLFSSITRGPEVGEIYYIGETATGKGIYHSTDFGQTATCMDSTLNTNINFGSITADLTPGVLYGYSSPENLYISYNYGQEGSWIFRGSDYHGGTSGRSEGHLYCDISRHSEDYGENFIEHSLNGYFGLLKTPGIDNENEVGYALVYEWGVPDTLWLLISYDNYENLEIQHVFNDYIGTNRLTRGYENGELFLYRKHNLHGKKLLYSNDYGETWELKNFFNCPNLPIKGIVGGRQPGELFMNIEYFQLMGQIRHTYIYHSLDYGETFTVYHPFSFGPPPYYANFDAEPLTGIVPLSVQFTDLSSGENIQNWEWDFQNDGIIDSYEQNPVYTYQDTGSYSVKLSIDFGGFDFLIRQSYIHVTNGSGIDNYELGITNYELNNYPNPFNPITTIEFTAKNAKDAKIEIYNIKGQKVDELSIKKQQTTVNWNAESIPSGIYLYKLKVNGKDKSVRKCLLLK